MKIRIRRGKPVNAIVEIETDKVMCAYAAGRGGKLELADGGMIALNGPEWEDWLKGGLPSDCGPVVMEEFPEVPFDIKNDKRKIRKRKSAK